MTDEVPACEPEPAPSAQPIPAPEDRAEPMSCQPAAEEEGAGLSLQESAKKKLPRPILVGIGIVLLLAIVALIASCFICTHKNWIEATCTEPRTCVECGKTEGGPLGHEWREATCTEPRMCIWCDATEGEPLGYAAGEWEAETDITAAKIYKTQVCSICGEELDSEVESIESFINEKTFAFSPSEFADRMEKQLDSVNSKLGTKYDVTLSTSDNMVLCVVLDGSSKAFAVGFLDGSGDNIADKDSREIQMLMGASTDGDTEHFAGISLAFLMTIDPTIGIKDSADFCSDIAGKAESGDTVTSNGVTYAMIEYSSDEVCFLAKIM